MLDILLNSDLIETFFIALLFLTPLSALLIYVLFRKRVHKFETFSKILILIGLIGPVNLILWSVYNTIENHFGLDSIVALIINFAIFVCIGLAAGLLLRRWLRGKSFSQTSDSSK